MIAYIDSSVLLRVLLNQQGRLREFSKVTRPVASQLLKTETLRTLDRLRLLGKLSEDDFVDLTATVHENMQSVELIRLTEAIMSNAGGSFPVALGTLDAIHLVSAQMWRSSSQQELTFLTHDILLGKAARAAGFEVLGI